MKALEQFHPAVRDWFLKQFPAPTDPQAEAWPAIKAGKHTLIAAPTGSGKTLAAFLSAIDDLVWKAIEGTLTDETHIVYVSPLKALSNDIKINLQEPLKGIQANLEAAGISGVEIRTLVRTGDTPAKERAAMTKTPPHIVVTTPESLYILLTSDGGRKMLSTVRTLIVDEIHAMVDDKRGSHLSLSIERLEALVHSHTQTQPPISDSKLQIQESLISDFKFEIQKPKLVRVGLSATQKPIEEVARFLVGTHNIEPDGSPRCTIIDTGHMRKLDLAIEVPNSPLESLMSNEVWEEIYDRLAQMIRQHKTTLVFVNTRRMAERVARHLGERLGDENVTSHHGSLAREIRLAAEQRLKSGELSALVATASLELGIDIGAVDLVVQIGSTRAISTLLQRIGRSNHTVSGFPKGRIFPLSRDELVECAALIDSVRRGELDHLEIPAQPLDILAQQIVAASAPEEWKEDDLFEMVRRAYPYRNLKREKFDEVIRMLSEGFTTRRGRRGTYLHHDAVNQRIRGRRGARLMSITNGGAIPDTSDYRVILEPSETFVGTLNEDFAIESLAGDIFQLGNSSYEIKRVGAGEVRVLDAHGQPPSIPFWLGEAPGRSEELSVSVSRLRSEIAKRLDENEEAREFDLTPLPACGEGLGGGVAVLDDLSPNPSPLAERGIYGSALQYLVGQVGLSQAAAQQIVEYLAMTKIALGAMPTQEQIVVERFFDENGSTHVVIHAPFGSRLNRAWGLALRKRFCRAFNFELQAAATEDSIVLSLGPTHSFPLETIFNYLNSKGVCDVLVQALLNAPMFNIRWRWNATRALAIPRWRSGGKVAPQLQRMAAEDLLALVFPDQLACAENLSGPIEVPAHPLVEQTVRDCLEEAMDIHGLERLLESIERGERTLIAREMVEPSPLAQEILTAKPYAFLDDAPAEERRTLAVMNRRFLDAETAADLGRLDQAAIDRVREEAWPGAQNADELHDALMQLGFITAEEGAKNDWMGLFEELVRDRRATILSPTPQPQREQRSSQRHAEESLDSAVSAESSAACAVGLWIAAERLNQLRAVYPDAELHPEIGPPPSYARETWVAEDALVEILRGRLDALGPVTVAHLANSFSLSTSQIEIGLAKLEGEGFAMQGHFTPEDRGGSPNVSEGESTSKDAGESRLVGTGMRALQIEWCSRRLLARIHSYTLNRLRKEIEPVSAADFMRFLFVWQKVANDHRTEGAASVAAILDQLEGFEAPAGSWESEILPARITDYDPAWLDALCLSGRLTWLRLSPPRISPDKSSSTSPVRSTPVVLLNRKNVATWSLAFPARENGTNFSTNTQIVSDYLKQHGASFFVDIVSGTNLLPSMVEEALGELVFRGLITADSFTGLRALLTPLSKTTSRAIESRRRRRKPVYSMDEAGRWVILQKDKRGQALFPTAQSPATATPELDRESIEAVAQKLLQRYGVVFRKLLDRESINLPWRELLRVLRRLEARGEIRGGRFVGGFTGEQFATADAVHLLRSLRRTQPDGTMLSVSAADPLNMLGILVPGPRLSPAASNRLLYRDGVPIAILEAREIRYLVEMDAAEQWHARNALLRRRIPPKVRAYLNQSGSTTSPTTISRLTH